MSRSSLCSVSAPKGSEAVVGGGVAAPKPNPFPNGDAAGAYEAAGSVRVDRPAKPSEPNSMAGEVPGAEAVVPNAPRFSKPGDSKEQLSEDALS